MKAKKTKKLPSKVIVLAVSGALLISMTLALLMNSVNLKRTFSVSNFKSECVVYFDTGSGTIPCDTMNNIEVSLDPSADRFIGNLRADFKYTGCGVGLARVKIVEEWSTYNEATNTRTVQPYQIAVPYIFGDVYDYSSTGNQSAWYDNRGNDYHMYYATAVRCYSDTKAEVIPLITGLDVADMDFDTIPGGTELHISIQTDVIQVNRYPQFWKIATLPWNESDSSTEVTFS